MARIRVRAVDSAVRSRSHHTNIFLSLAIYFTTIIFSDMSYAGKDAAGAADHPLIGARFPEAVIKSQKVQAFDEYQLITGPVKREGKIETGERLEGKITTTVYEIPKERSTLEVLRNYEQKFSELGFEILYRCGDKACGGRNFNLTVVPYMTGFGGNENGQRYLAARATKQDATAYVSLYVVKNASVGGSKRNLVYVRLIVVEVEKMKTRLVVINADEMQKEISSSGHVALYGILFDFDSAKILSDSRPALDEIAKLMKVNTTLKLLVVGHSDNKGSLDYNLKLSAQRAAAIKTDLVSTYGLSAERLDAHGVGFLSPVASNASEEGRALNRRVELVQSR